MVLLISFCPFSVFVAYHFVFGYLMVLFYYFVCKRAKYTNNNNNNERTKEKSSFKNEDKKENEDMNRRKFNKLNDSMINSDEPLAISRLHV